MIESHNTNTVRTFKIYEYYYIVITLVTVFLYHTFLLLLHALPVMALPYTGLPTLGWICFCSQYIF
jgi:hypothetical protein